MGDPSLHYKEMLHEAQRLCECSIKEKAEWFNGKYAEFNKCNKHTKELEEDLLRTKEFMKNDNLFYYCCGNAQMSVILDPSTDINASAASMSHFKDFISIRDKYTKEG